MKDPQLRPSIEGSQERAIEELEEIPVDKNTKEDHHCVPTKQDTISVLLQVFQMYFKSSFSNNW